MCWHVSAPEKLPTPGKVPTRAGTSRCRHVPTSLILIIWTFLFGCWYELTCVNTWKGANTWECADTCRHMPTSLILIIWTFLFANWDVIRMCWHVSAPEKVPTPWKVPTHAGTSRCWHVPTRADIPDTDHMDFFYLDADMYWHVSAPEKVPTHGNVPTRADTSRCRHVPTSLIKKTFSLVARSSLFHECSVTQKVYMQNFKRFSSGLISWITCVNAIFDSGFINIWQDLLNPKVTCPMDL